jgi:hypothetical protein
MGLPHEDISRLQEQSLRDRQANRAAIQKLKEELKADIDSSTEFAATQIGLVRQDLARIRQEITDVAMTQGRITADLSDQIKALQARVTKLEGKGLF